MMKNRTTGLRTGGKWDKKKCVGLKSPEWVGKRKCGSLTKTE